MPEENKNENKNDSGNDPGSTGSTSNPSFNNQGFTQDQLNAIVAEEKRKHQAKIEELSKTLEATISENKTVKEQFDELKQAQRNAELTVDRLTVGAEKGLPPQLALRLQGESREELEKDAEAVLGYVKPAKKPLETGPRDEAKTATDMNSLMREAAGYTDAD